MGKTVNLRPSPWKGNNPSTPENFYKSKKVKKKLVETAIEKTIDKKEHKNIQENIKPSENDPYAEILKDL